jgi:hypothetical protein
MRTQYFSFVAFLFFSESVLAVSASLQGDFAAACFEAFKSAQPQSDDYTSHLICDCAAPESKRQGASDSAIRRETGSIRRDPKYRIQDAHVLDALHYCAIETLHARE